MAGRQLLLPVDRSAVSAFKVLGSMKVCFDLLLSAPKLYYKLPRQGTTKFKKYMQATVQLVHTYTSNDVLLLERGAITIF